MALKFHGFYNCHPYSVLRADWTNPVVRMLLPIQQRPALFVGTIA